MSASESRRANRRARRALTAAGVAVMSRAVIERGAIVAAQEKGLDLVDLIAYNIDAVLREVVDQGGDVLGQTVVNIGAHPDYPDAVTIEAKVASLVKADGGPAL